MEFKWNTGRLYQADGQWIVAIVVDDGSVLFADLSRGIDGRITRSAIEPTITFEALRRYVMEAYDHNDYKADATSWAFHMQVRRN